VNDPLPRFTLISSAAPLGSLAEALRQVEDRHGKLFELDVYLTHSIQEQTIEPAQVLSSIQESAAVLFDLRGSPDRAVALVAEGLSRTAECGIPFIPVFGGGPTVLRLLRMGGFSMARVMRERRGGRDRAVSTNYRRIKQLNQVVEKLGSLLPVGVLRHARNWVRCTEYWTNSGADNLCELLLFVGQQYAGLPVKARPPIVFPDDGFYDLENGHYYTRLDDYMADRPLDPKLPTVLVILYGGTILGACIAGSQELLDALAQQANLVPFVADGIGTAAALRRHVAPRAKPLLPIDAIVSLQWFRLEGGPLGGDPQVTYDLLRTLGAPLYTPATSYNRSLSLWERSRDGIAPVETLTTVALPEMDGAIEPIFLFGLRDLTGAAPTCAATIPAPGRGRRLAERVLRRSALRRKPNSQKRIALVIYNYPPGESTLGAASFLDVFASAEAILRRLQAEGYHVTLPAEPIKDLLLRRGLVHGAQWTGRQVTARHATRVAAADYRRWYQQLPAEIRQQTEELFGPPPGELMTDGEDILLAGVQLGNVLLAIQPSRGVHEDPAKIHHDKALPPHHQYIAFYRYLEEVFGADAVVHVGTHGTLEFMPGKEVALSEQCAPDALMGTMPHVYIYHVVNASEAMIAKRRSYAQTVTYASPSFAPAELYGDYLALEDLLGEYQAQLRLNPARAGLILKEIKGQATVAGLGFDGQSEPAEATLDRLHAELTVLKRTAIPIGLHVFGERLAGDELAGYLALVARHDRPAAPALSRLLAEQQGLDYDALLAAGDPAMSELDDAGRLAIDSWLRGDEPAVFRDGGRPLASFLDQVKSDVEESDEMGGLLRALAGQFLMPNLAGDPVRSPETYPTGRNAFQFDPTRIPTSSALARGRSIAEQSLNRYLALHGGYPSAVGVVLWGFETCKTYGETIGQILAYLGVRLERGEGYFMQPEAISPEELGRPRIDVVVNICGFFRDLFPNQVRMLDKAFRLVAALDEDATQNRVRANWQASVEKGGDPQVAAARIFGPPAGEYGNRLSTLIESGGWQDEAELAEMFLDRTQYLYGENLHGLAAPGQLEQCLGRVELVTQVRDSLEYDVTDLDHYYEYFGGLARTVEQVRGGRAPAVLIADTTTEMIQVRSVQEAIRLGVVTRLVNPMWIDGLLAHDFHGAQKVADRVEYLIGLDATTHAVGSNVWSMVAERLILDEEMRRRLLENNPYAAAEMAQKLGEAIRRGYWQASEDEQRRLREAYMEIEGWIEGGE
jgi:cobaltochelatase CobN/magnesium chelatase subunit H